MFYELENKDVFLMILKNVGNNYPKIFLKLLFSILLHSVSKLLFPSPTPQKRTVVETTI